MICILANNIFRYKSLIILPHHKAGDTRSQESICYDCTKVLEEVPLKYRTSTFV